MFNKPMLALFIGCLCIGIWLAVTLHTNFENSSIDTDNPIIHENTQTAVDDNHVDNNANPTRHDSNSTSPDKEKTEDFYSLIIGIDFRENILMLNTDTIMVAHVIPQTKKIKLLSIPRDTKIGNLQGKPVKVNSLFNEGYQYALKKGRENPSLLSGDKVKMGQSRVPEEYVSSGIVELRETIEQFLELDIEYSVLVNFQTVISLVDEVGGIEIDVDRSMQWDSEADNTHIHLEKGRQMLDGRDALNFARFRKDNRGTAFFSNDFERGQRQQQVITALADKLTSWGSLPKIFNLIDIVTSNVKTDMSLRKMQNLARQFYGSLNSESIISIPFNGYWESPYVLINDSELEAMIQRFTSVDSLE